MSLEVKALVKEFSGYGSKFKLGPIDIVMGPGETVGVLGKNGAGKSTFFQLLTGAMDATSGDVLLDGEKIRTDTPLIKRQIGYLPQYHTLPLWATLDELLAYGARLLELTSQPLEAITEYWDLVPYRKKPLKTLSYGTQKRIALALATFSTPKLTILDEPFSGLDIYHIRALELEIKRRKELGLITVLSTHIASQTSELCDRAVILADGKASLLTPWSGIEPKEREQTILEAFFP